IDDFEKSFAWVDLVGPDPLTLDDTNPQSHCNGTFCIRKAASPTGWQRASKVRIDLSRLLNEIECGVDGVGRHRIKMDSCVEPARLVENFSDQRKVILECGGLHGEVTIRYRLGDTSQCPHVVLRN